MDTDMGDRLSDGSAGAPRPAHPGAPPAPGAGPALERLLAGVLRPDALDAAAEQRAVAAFRAARAAGARPARTRRRDDWSPRGHGSTRRRLRATFTLSLAGLTLGGVAYAAIDSAGHTAHDGDDARRPTHAPADPAPPSGAPTGTEGAPHTPARPPTARDTEAHCRQYEHLKDAGKALQSTAWQRLVEEAGGTNKVAAYCARQFDRPTAPARPSASRPAETHGKGDNADGNVGGNGNGNGSGSGAGDSNSAGKGNSAGSGSNTGAGNNTGSGEGTGPGDTGNAGNSTSAGAGGGENTGGGKNTGKTG
jgi:hypothetical protein